jgi:two-component system, NtrC family, response regulator AtoC
MPRFSVLIVDDEKTLARSIKLSLEEHGYEAEVANDGDRALELLEKMHPDLVLLDLRLPKVSGLDLLKKIRGHDPSVAAVMMTAYGTIEGAVEAMKLGAFDYVTKPIDLDELKVIVERAQEDRRLRQEVRYYRERGARDFEIASLVGGCASMQRALGEIKHLASLAEAPAVLLTGETGTGKSLVARALHAQSRRARGPFIEVDCTSLPPSLIETELFGYEKGSFTDAKESKIGLIEAAEGGTAFLDEVGDLALPLQGKLLRAIEEHTVRRVGSVRDRKIDAWIVGATNKDLAAMLAAGSFRKDLYYRLAVVTVHLPPLRERTEDIGLLAEFFLRRFRAKYAKRVSRLSDAALTSLREYDWPGNVRELRHVIERAVLASSTTAIEVDQGTLETLPKSKAASPVNETLAAPGRLPPEGIRLAEWERAIIERALSEAHGNQTSAARLLGVSRDTLRYRLAKFKITR